MKTAGFMLYRKSAQLVSEQGFQTNTLFCTTDLFSIFSNGENVEGATHKQVVDLIKSGGDTLTLTGKSILC